MKNIIIFLLLLCKFSLGQNGLEMDLRGLYLSPNLNFDINGFNYYQKKTCIYNDLDAAIKNEQGFTNYWSAEWCPSQKEYSSGDLPYFYIENALKDSIFRINLDLSFKQPPVQLGTNINGVANEIVVQILIGNNSQENAYMKSLFEYFEQENKLVHKNSKRKYEIGFIRLNEQFRRTYNYNPSDNFLKTISKLKSNDPDETHQPSENQNIWLSAIDRIISKSNPKNLNLLIILKDSLTEFSLTSEFEQEVASLTHAAFLAQFKILCVNHCIKNTHQVNNAIHKDLSMILLEKLDNQSQINKSLWDYFTCDFFKIPGFKEVENGRIIFKNGELYYPFKGTCIEMDKLNIIFDEALNLIENDQFINNVNQNSQNLSFTNRKTFSILNPQSYEARGKSGYARIEILGSGISNFNVIRLVSLSELNLINIKIKQLVDERNSGQRRILMQGFIKYLKTEFLYGELKNNVYLSSWLGESVLLIDENKVVDLNFIDNISFEALVYRLERRVASMNEFINLKTAKELNMNDDYYYSIPVQIIP